MASKGLGKTARTASRCLKLLPGGQKGALRGVSFNLVTTTIPIRALETLIYEVNALFSMIRGHQEDSCGSLMPGEVGLASRY